MGPEATALFYQKIIQLTPAKTDQDHLRVVIVSNPKIPDRNGHLLNSSDSPFPALVQSAQDLHRLGADFIAIPCNTAHWFWFQLCKAVPIPILNIINETVEAVARHRQAESGFAHSQIGLLATDATLQMELYHKALLTAGLHPMVPPAALQQNVHRSIYCIKSGGNKEEAVGYIQEAISHLEQQGIYSLIYGCTELKSLSDRLTPTVPVFDSLDILARATVDFASNQPSGSP
jgi:aspartate racemase